MASLRRREFLGMAAAGLGASVGIGSLGVLGMAWAAPGELPAPGSSRKLNVLHIISDDLCNRLGCYGDPMVKSPNIDRLAARGVQFDRAYCQYPLCNPSRASFMTGLRPDTTRAYKNATHFRENVPDAVTIPQSFQKAGYHVARVGKIFHYGVPSQIGTDGLDDPISWEKVVNPKGRDVDDISVVEVLELGPDNRARTATGKQLKNTGGTLSWLAADGTDEEQTDGKGAAAAIQLLEEYARGDDPFYLAVGFYRPHTPFVAPKNYYGLYSRDDIPVPPVPPNLGELFPAAALASQRPEEMAMDEDLRRQAIQAYYASTTFMDAQVGHLLDALDRLDLAQNTIVVFHSDHGYHLGEKNLWKKQSVFEESARVPFLITVPGGEASGRVCRRPVELLSLHKTLTDLCGIEAGPKTEGTSLRPLLEDPEAAWDRPAFTQVVRSKQTEDYTAPITGRSVRTERWRYTEWDEGRAGVELYDHDNDPGEMQNVAGSAEYQDTVRELKALLEQSVRGQ